MKTWMPLFIAALIVALDSTARAGGPGFQDGGFVYQGVLEQNGVRYNGTADLEFRLYDGPSGSGATQIGPTLAHGNQTIVDGTSNTLLNFEQPAPAQPVWNGQERWLEVRVRTPAGSASPFVALTPWQKIATAPYAAYALNSNTPFAWNAANAVFTGGNVGIGTASPSVGLHIADPTVARMRLDRVGGAMLTAYSTIGGGILGTENSLPLLMQTNNTTRMTVEADGDVGIGTASPFGRLHVSGGPVAADDSMGFQLRDTVTPSTVDADMSMSGSTLRLENFSAGSIALRTNSTAGSALDRVTVNNTGSVGIGTTSPVTKLHVQAGPVSVSDNKGIEWRDEVTPSVRESRITMQGTDFDIENLLAGDIVLRTSTTEGVSTDRLTVAASGGVGVGAESPLANLHVRAGSAGAVAPTAFTVLALENSADTYLSLLSPAANARSVIFGEPSNNIAGIIRYNGNNVPDGFDFVTGGFGSRLTITPTGNVGINANTPEDLLHVYGGDSGLAAASGSRVIVEDDASHYLEMLTTNAGETGILFSNLAGGNASCALTFNSAGNANGLQLRTGTNDTSVTITSGGLIGMGRAPTTNRLEVEGNASKTTSGSWLANSDRRIKTDIETVSSALDTLEQVRLASFRYTPEYLKAHPSIEDRRYLNVIAQEFAQVFPEHVKGSGEFLPSGEEILQVDIHPLTIYSAAAIQELHAEVQDLRDANDVLRAEIAHMRRQIDQIITERDGR